MVANLPEYLFAPGLIKEAEKLTANCKGLVNFTF
ncbi:hypothetical protein SAMN05192529_10528 [Arachidicoccus rhizosphaerae]|jgi:hypothetical protein|uniref:Uncharacterized protein n=1 Tax=Arachidicoccus rhizosphaerae TaxID=551991 RepID=A0A1H3X944_9BACT|nr:hypothetical protein SAMN05192529_10528 [Arachidicoccus rhizosphaerae]